MSNAEVDTDQGCYVCRCTLSKGVPLDFGLDHLQIISESLEVPQTNFCALFSNLLSLYLHSPNKHGRGVQSLTCHASLHRFRICFSMFNLLLITSTVSPE